MWWRLFTLAVATSADGSSVAYNHTPHVEGHNSTQEAELGIDTELKAKQQEQEIAQLRAELWDANLKLRAAWREKKIAESRLAHLNTTEEQEASNASQIKQMLDIALENSQKAGVKHPLRTSTVAPTVEVGNITMPKAEYEDTVLAGSFAVIGFCFLVPCMWPCRRRCETRLYRVYPLLAILNALLLSFTLAGLDMINFNEVFFAGVKLIEVLMDTTQKVLMICAVVVGGFVVWKFKDRILDALGIESSSLVIGDFRDWATCWSMKRFRPIELFIWKVEGLPAAKLTTNNSTFCEITLGYNMSMRTRVHHSAGHTCVFKESVQLNFDPYDTEARLTLSVKHQGSLGSDAIAKVQLGAAQVQRLCEPHDRARVLGWISTAPGTEDASSFWAPSRFKPLDLVPAGKIFLRFAPVPLEEEEDEGGLASSCCCCCPDGEESLAEP